MTKSGFGDWCRGISPLCVVGSTLETHTHTNTHAHTHAHTIHIPAIWKTGETRAVGGKNVDKRVLVM